MGLTQKRISEIILKVTKVLLGILSDFKSGMSPERRAGQLLIEMVEKGERSKGTKGQLKGKDSSGKPVLLESLPETLELEDLDFTKALSKRCQA